MSYSPPSHQASSRTEQLIPKKQQWALINQYKALQFERMKQMQKMLDIQKKKQFKQQLDYQMNNKNDVQSHQKELDRKYYEYITKKSNQMKEREDAEKFNKFMKRKLVQQENQYNLDHMRNSRGKDKDSGYHLDIGLKSQIQRKNIEEYQKRVMLDTLDKQLQIKAEQKRKQKQNSMETDQANLRYQFEQFDKRRGQNKKFGQNENVYNYYKNLQEEKKMRQREFQHRIVDEAAAKIREQQNYKTYIKQREKSAKTTQMKNTLDLQIDIQNKKHQQQKRVNPEQHTYSVIGNMFKQKQSPYNKQQYSQYLRRQAQQASLKKKKQQYMSQQQYRINMNQLNRAVSGTYAHQQYIDRSVGAIGDNNRRINLTQMSDKVHDQDSDVVKMRLESLKNRNKFGGNDSYIY